MSPEKKKGCRRRSPTLPLAASGQTNFSHPFAEGTSALGMRVRDSPEIGSQSHIQITAAPALTFLSLSPTVVGGLSVLGNCAPRKRSPRKLDMNLDDRWTDAQRVERLTLFRGFKSELSLPGRRFICRTLVGVLVNFVLDPAYHSCLALPSVLTQPGACLLDEPSTGSIIQLAWD